MAFFARDQKGRVVFTGSSKKHAGQPIEKVAREDPGYLQWARRERTVGLPLDIFEAIENVMTLNGVPFNRTPKR